MKSEDHSVFYPRIYEVLILFIIVKEKIKYNMRKKDNSPSQKSFFFLVILFNFFLLRRNITEQLLIALLKLIICVFGSQQPCSLNFQNR